MPVSSWAAGGELAVALGPVAHPAVRPAVQELAVPEGHRRQIVATDHRRRLPCLGEPDEPAARLAQGRAVGKVGIAGQPVGPADQPRIQMVDRAEAFRPGQRIGLRALERQVARGPAARRLARVDLVREVAVDQPLRPGGRAQRHVVRVGAGDAGHQPVGAAEIEARVHAQRHDRGRGTGGADAGDDAEHALGGVVAQVAIALRERQHDRQREALDPGLELARLIARVRTRLEHGDDHDPDRDRLGPRTGRQARERQCQHHPDPDRPHRLASPEPSTVPSACGGACQGTVPCSAWTERRVELEAQAAGAAAQHRAQRGPSDGGGWAV